MVPGSARLQHIHAPHHLIERAEAHLRHVTAHLLGDEEKEIDGVLRSTLEPGAQGRVLRGNAYGTGIEVALAHHDAAHGHQWRGGETELLGAQDRKSTRLNS